MKRIILNLSGLSGSTRAIVSEKVQLKLFDFGFYWAKNPDNGPTRLGAAFIILYYNSDNVLNYALDCYVPTGEIEVFDACHSLDAFFEAVKNSQTITYNDSGVEVIITRDEIRLDAQALLNKVTERAQVKQQLCFPKQKS